MTFSHAIRTGFAKSFDASGRASPSEFWRFWTFHVLSPVVLTFLVAPVVAPASHQAAVLVAGLGLLLYIITIPGVFSGLIRRQHDIGRSGKLGATAYALVLLVALGTFIYLMSLSPFRMTGEFFEASGAKENPAVLLVTGPIMLMFGFFELLIFVLVAGMILLTVGIPMIMALLTLAVGLARPSEPGENRYGPVPAEAAA